MVGINARMARKHVERQWFSKKQQLCAHTDRHMVFSERASTMTLLWSFLRDPLSRVRSSYFFFRVSRGGRIPTIQSYHAYLHSQRNFQFRYLTNYTGPELQTDAQQRSAVESSILHVYDFVGVLERRVESLAVMSLLWKRPVSDMIVLSAKSTGGYDDGQYQHRCVFLQPPTDDMPTPVGYEQENSLDYWLYHLVNRTLDATIQALGEDIVQERMRQLQYWQHRAETVCMKQARFPCMSNGTKRKDTNCYRTDSGCGYPCVDELFRKEGMGG